MRGRDLVRCGGHGWRVRQLARSLSGRHATGPGFVSIHRSSPIGSRADPAVTDGGWSFFI